MPKVRGNDTPAEVPPRQAKPQDPLPPADSSVTIKVGAAPDEAQVESVIAAEQPAKKPVRSRAKPTADKKPDFNAVEAELGSLEDEEEFTSILYYGPPGTHKTTNALRLTLLNHPGKVLVINAEGGLRKLALQSHGVDISRVQVWPRRGERVTYGGLEALFFRLIADFKEDPKAWAGVVWDSVTEIAKTLIDVQVEGVLETQAELQAKGVRVRDERSSRFDTNRDDYSVMSQQLRQLLRKYRYLPCHVIITALERRLEDEDTKRVMYGPDINPAMQSDLMAHVNVVMRTSVDGDRGIGEVLPTKRQHAKDRDNVLPGRMVDPGFERVVGYVNRELVEATDSLQSSAQPDRPTDRPKEESKPETDSKPPAKPRRSRAKTDVIAQKADIVVSAPAEGSIEDPPF